MDFRPSIVALIMFSGLFDLSDLVKMSLYPASSKPLGQARRNNTCSRARGLKHNTSGAECRGDLCGTVVPTMGTSIMFFLASSTAFLIASDTS